MFLNLKSFNNESLFNHYDILAVDIFIDDTDSSGGSNGRNIHNNCSLATGRGPRLRNQDR